jgi:hypothetical protein
VATPEEREIERLAQRASEYRWAVNASTSNAWRYLLLSMILLGLAAAMVAMSSAGRGSYGVAAFMLVMLVILLQVVMGNNIRACMAQCYEDGFQPSRRSYLGALLDRPPMRRLWAQVESAEADSYPQDYVIEDLRLRPRSLTIRDKDGTRSELYRASYPDVFDRCVEALAARGLLKSSPGGSTIGGGAT